MKLAVVKKKKVLSIYHLLRAVLKYVYDEKNMSIADLEQMQHSIVDWHNAIKIEREKLKSLQSSEILRYGKVFTTDHGLSWEEEHLERMASLIRDNDLGKLNRRKVLFKETGVDYRKFHRLPEVYQKSDFLNGQKALEQSMKDNPEDYE